MKTSKQEQTQLREEGKKRCSKCAEVVNLEDFTKDPNTKDGYGSCCKKCKRKKDDEYRKRPDIRQKHAFYQKEYKKRNPKRYGHYVKPTERKIEDWVHSSEPGQGHRIPGYVYIFQWGEFVKIGRATQPHTRVRKINKFLPTPGKLINIIKTNDMVHAEFALHLKFAKSRQGGEWFSLSETDIEYLSNLEFLE